MKWKSGLCEGGRGRPVQGRPRQGTGELMRVRSISLLLNGVCEAAVSDFSPDGVADLFVSP